MSIQKIASVKANDLSWYQASGGNVSFKIDDIIQIKKSGFRISEISETEGYMSLPLSEIKNLIWDLLNQNLSDQVLEKKYLNLIKNYQLENSSPSMELAFHLFLKKYVMHSHPTLVNVLNCSKEGQEILQKEFGDQALCVPYIKPGILIAQKIIELTSEKKIPSIIFLFNHGLILTGDSVDEIKNLIKIIEQKISKYFSTNLLSKSGTIFSSKALYPDFLVFCSKEDISKKNIMAQSFYDEIYNNHAKILSMIKLLSYTPLFISAEQGLEILSMEQEKFRQNRLEEF